MAPTLADATSSKFKLCRYFASATYTGVKLPLINQNLLFIAAGDGGTQAFTCPGQGTTTWAQQPSS